MQNEITEAEYLESHAYDASKELTQLILHNHAVCSLHSMESRFSMVNATPVGAMAICPVCKSAFKKKTKNHKFCHIICKDRYWNLKRSLK